MFGSVLFLWIVSGLILCGTVHDYMSGMISLCHEGASIAELKDFKCGLFLKLDA
ncbi:carbon starvation CstA family protein [Petralouisia muris]|uniref:carbon starvation CstA family protein n=1 Tax=Petralouisia muris TaxID=3032872 RepID=UPI0038CD30B3